MSKIWRHSFSFALVASLVFSSVGYTAISVSCPKMKQERASCSDCKQTSKTMTKECCKAKAEHKVVKADFEKPIEFKTALSSLPLLPIAIALLQNDVANIAELHLTAITPITPQYSVEKCALLATFVI